VWRVRYERNRDAKGPDTVIYPCARGRGLETSLIVCAWRMYSNATGLGAKTRAEPYGRCSNPNPNPVRKIEAFEFPRAVWCR
jgi:hypothetical protein